MSRLGKEDVKDAVVISTVITPPVISVEIDNPTLKPKEAICDRCRNKPGDIFCDGWPMCFDCLEKIIERENAIAMQPKFRSQLPELFEN